jgi:flagellar basal-body rod protein FlgG
MIRSLTTAATGMIAQELRMNVTANNLANASTTGFKRARAEFEELMTEKLVSANAPPTGQQAAPSPLEVGLGVKVGATQRNFSRGDVLVTNNDMDIYIEGDGFLKVTRPNGTLAYTRAGNLRVDGQGRLVTQGGLPLDPPVQIPDDAKKVTIGRDGTVAALTSARELPIDIGRIELATFINPAGLEGAGQNLLTETAGSGPPNFVTPGELGSGTISQGALENSNVKVVDEMIALVTTQRTYEMNSKVIQTADQMLQKLSNLR